MIDCLEDRNDRVEKPDIREASQFMATRKQQVKGGAWEYKPVQVTQRMCHHSDQACLSPAHSAMNSALVNPLRSMALL